MSQSQLEDIIRYHRYLYYEKSDPMISDYDFDKLYDRFGKDFPDSEVLTETECPRKFWPKYEKRYEKFKV